MISNLIGDQISAGECIKSLLADEKFTKMKLMVAFAKQAGIGRLFNDFKDFRNRGGAMEGIVGIDHRGSTMQGLQQLSTLSDNNVFVHYEKSNCTFHPKVYMFEGKVDKAVLIGSTNLTCGGLFTNHEANVLLSTENSTADAQFISDLDRYYHSLLKDVNTKRVEKGLLDSLFNQGLVEDETRNRAFSKIIHQVSNVPFGTGKQKKAPPSVSPTIALRPPAAVFATTLSSFDVSARSLDPVILIPLKALRENSSFWEWPGLFTLSPGGYPERYAYADIHIAGVALTHMFVRIYFYERKSEFRLQCGPIKRNGRAGDIMTIEKRSADKPEYVIRLISKSDPQYGRYLKFCTNEVSRQKSYGYTTG